MSVLAYGLNITIEEYYKLVKSSKKWKPENYPKTCPKCGAKTKITQFDDGWEIWCMYNDSKFNPIRCDWEIWILNPLHPSNKPEFIRKEGDAKDG